MAERFISLATLLHPPADPAPAMVEVSPPEPELEEAGLATVRLTTEFVTFHARLAEAFGFARDRLLAEFASEVLGRELQLAPVAINVIGARLLDDFAADGPVALRLSPQDCARIQLGVPVESDPQLRPGDAVLVVRDGELESSLGIRLDAVLRGTGGTG